jgi:DNA polymerase-4
MKSIDEGVIDFTQTTELIKARDLVDIGHEIKESLLQEIGNYMKCNIGIATNRFLAKTAAGLHKPDGLDIITHENLRNTLGTLKLTDLTGIAGRNEARLNKVGIYTPLEFLDADPITLHKIVFKSIVGEQWHQRLRGWEVDDVSTDVKTVGGQYVLEAFGLSRTQIMQRLHHLCESVGHRLRLQNKAARGVLVTVKSRTAGHWHARHMCALPFFSNQAIYAQAAMLFSQAPDDVIKISITCYELEDNAGDQLSLFGDEIAKDQYVTEAIDTINRRFGDRTVHAADTLGTGIYVKQKVPFGSTRYL